MNVEGTNKGERGKKIRWERIEENNGKKYMDGKGRNIKMKDEKGKGGSCK
jgi:hypothetical protein